ncbi:MAG TPA: S-methyl-5-thioribose-1-phosphate isomerase [Methylovirgula sp.]|nr:S-methyl-5-thioribose-1-phosphate isomerase [Methylovirgula sp.]
MRVDGNPYRTIWRDGGEVRIIDQTRLPHEFVILSLKNLTDAAIAIKDMKVRGAPLIGVTAAYGLALAMRRDPSDAGLAAASAELLATRPTAVNLAWALAAMKHRLQSLPPSARYDAALAGAGELAEIDIAQCAAIGRHGLDLIRAIAEKKGGPVNILTHCNAGWLATVDWGTATAPIYKAHDAGIDIRVFVDETRPRNQGASLTAWELAHENIPHRVIVDNAGGHLMQRGAIDLVIVGTDRTTATGDVCNKIGTYLKALAAHDNGVPFYVAAPSSSIDFSLEDASQIPIEERSEREVTHVRGLTEDGRVETIRLTPKASPAANPAFDVTPARLVSGLITERGVLEPNKLALATAFPERVRDRDDSGSSRSKTTNAIDAKELELDLREEPVATFSHTGRGGKS